MSHNTSDSALCEVISRICERIGSTRAKDLQLAFSLNRPIAKYFPSHETTNVVDFAGDYFISKILSKWIGWDNKGVSKRAAALIGWESDEVLNQSTNRRLLNLQRGSGFPGSDMTTIISIAQRHISKVLGNFRLRKVLDSCRWGPGATWDYPRGTSRDTKLSGRMSTTREAQPFMKLLIECDPNWCEAITGFYPSGPFSLVKSFWEFTDAARFSTVPKDFDKDRCIDMQPTANGYLQQGVGQYIRHKLKSVGINLNSQETNQELAASAYFLNRATVDLQSASDSVTYQLVSLLIPPDWCQYLCALRTPYTQFGRRGPKRKIEKFSAMGNAFTFELETLIFWALSRACVEFEGVKDDIVCVYGDDIIVNSNVYEKLVYVLSYCGFRVNESKSFRSGPFYESCGKHYFMGSDITPVYQKKLVNSPEECIRFHNRLVRWGERIHGDPWFFDEALILIQALYFDTCRNRILRESDLPRIPLDTEGDDGFLSPEIMFKRDQNGGFYTFVLRSVSKMTLRVNNASYLQLKLNDRHYSNGHPRGWPSDNVGRGRWLLKRAYFYR